MGALIHGGYWLVLLSRCRLVAESIPGLSFSGWRGGLFAPVRRRWQGTCHEPDERPRTLGRGNGGSPSVVREFTPMSVVGALIDLVGAALFGVCIVANLRRAFFSCLVFSLGLDVGRVLERDGPVFHGSQPFFVRLPTPYMAISAGAACKAWIARSRHHPSVVLCAYQSETGCA